MRKHFYFVLLILITSCSNSNREREFLEKYAKGLSEFRTDLTDHFPNTIKSGKQLIIGYPAGVYANGMANIIFSDQVDSIQFRKTVRKLKLNNIASYKPTDSIFIIIGDTLDYTKKVSGIPIPSFEFYERDFGLNNKYLTENHKIYVLEVKSGEFMNKEYLTSNKDLPEKWKNGFSRGIATNLQENEVIYWLCVW